MRKFFEIPEINISMFAAENVATTGSTLDKARDELQNGTIIINGLTKEAAAAATIEIVSFKD